MHSEKFANPVRQAVETVVWCCVLWHEPEGHMSGPIVVREWNAHGFHRRVLEHEKQGRIARRETYRITAETNYMPPSCLLDFRTAIAPSPASATCSRIIFRAFLPFFPDAATGESPSSERHRKVR
jgi:hypothetical protein